MKLPWNRDSHSDEEWNRAEERLKFVRGHLRVAVNELEALLDRFETRRQEGQPSD